MTDNPPVKKPAIITDPAALPEPSRFNKKKVAIIAAVTLAGSAALVAIGYNMKSCDSDEETEPEVKYFYLEPDTTSDTTSTEAV